MSDTPNKPEDAAKLLDDGYSVVIFKNRIGSITAVACKPGQLAWGAMGEDRQYADGFTVGQALCRLAEKVTAGGSDGLPIVQVEGHRVEVDGRAPQDRAGNPPFDSGRGRLTSEASMTAEEIDRRGAELVAEAEKLAETAKTWTDLSNALFDPDRGILARAFATFEDREKFRLTDHYSALWWLIRSAQRRAELVAGAKQRMRW